MIAQTFRGPHNLYRRYQGQLEHSLTVSALAILVVAALWDFPVYPTNWVIVIGVAVLLSGLRWPLVAYLISVAAMIYPLLSLNLYVAVLFIAVSALGQRIFTHHLGATVLVLATPFLAQYHLHWLIPVLGGLWWGSNRGLWIGLLAAFWGKFLGGMAGANIDWLLLAGSSLDIEAITLRYETANSLETLILLIEPFATTPTMILYSLLQIIGWGVTGMFVGSLTQQTWVKYRTPWSILVVTAGGGLALMVTHLMLPYWLIEALTPEVNTVLQNPAGPLFSLLMVILVGTTVFTLREALELPVAPQKRILNRQPKQKKPRQAPERKLKLRPAQFLQRNKAEGRRKQRNQEREPVRRPVRVPHQSELPEWEPPQEKSGLIMLEID